MCYPLDTSTLKIKTNHCRSMSIIVAQSLSLSPNLYHWLFFFFSFPFFFFSTIHKKNIRLNLLLKRISNRLQGSIGWSSEPALGHSDLYILMHKCKHLFFFQTQENFIKRQTNLVAHTLIKVWILYVSSHIFYRISHCISDFLQNEM